MSRRLVARDALVKSFGDLLAIGFALQVAFIGGTADKRDFSENRRHGRAGQHEEL